MPLLQAVRLPKLARRPGTRCTTRTFWCARSRFKPIISLITCEDITVDDFIDVIDGNRKYCKCALSFHFKALSHPF